MSQLDRLREIRESLPETSERLNHGAPAFFYREKRHFLMSAWIRRSSSARRMSATAAGSA